MIEEKKPTMGIIENPFEKVRPKMTAARIELMSQLAKFGHNELNTSPSPDQWSAIEIAHHVYLTDGTMLEQIYLVQNEENPLIANIGEGAQHSIKTSEPPVSLDAVLGGMAARREEMFEYLSKLPAADWDRPLRHPGRGQLKFYQLVNTLPLHDQTHARQLAELKDAITPTRT